MRPEAPDFSPLAERYARSRPFYPNALFDLLASLAIRHDLAWDAATGSGQAAVGLAPRFERVVATDTSAEQIAHAIAHPRIEYRVAPSEESGIEGGAVDLITVAAAAHWFDPDRFGAEALRVARPGAVLAVWTYHVGLVEPPFGAPFSSLYWDLLKPYFAPATRLVDERYETLALPGEPIEAPATLFVEAEWTLAEALDFVGSWSGSRAFRAARGEDPAELFRPTLARLWGDAERRCRLRWPLFLRLTRLRPPAPV